MIESLKKVALKDIIVCFEIDETLNIHSIPFVGINDCKNLFSHIAITSKMEKLVCILCTEEAYGVM